MCGAALFLKNRGVVFLNILCIGDIVGKDGSETLVSQLKYIKQDYDIDFVIANGENATTGNGINRERADLLLDGGVDVITLGNHAFSKSKQVQEVFSLKYPVIRPLNMPEGTSGEGYIIKECCGKKIAVINALGRVFMTPCDCPFAAVKNLLQKIEADFIFLDFHAEATSEKKAMGYFLDGKVTAVFGTHTHVQTADEQLLPKKTAYITDLGMTGPITSVLGVKKEIAIKKFTAMMHEKYENAEGSCSIEGIVVETGENGLAKSIKRINIR